MCASSRWCQQYISNAETEKKGIEYIKKSYTSSSTHCVVLHENIKQRQIQLFIENKSKVQLSIENKTKRERERRCRQKVIKRPLLC
mmetsp:Transcript_34915/g.52734  ORF Transcript_34915/g.52734 Transcript_34915/m.52734 type:complete len:86 (-) Transcript_34915:932-1189(-)